MKNVLKSLVNLGKAIMKKVVKYICSSIILWTIYLSISFVIYFFCREANSLNNLFIFINDYFIATTLTLFSVYVASFCLIIPWLINFYKDIVEKLEQKELSNLFFSIKGSAYEFIFFMLLGFIFYLIYFSDSINQIHGCSMIIVLFCLISMVGIIFDGIQMLINLASFVVEDILGVRFTK